MSVVLVQKEDSKLKIISDGIMLHGNWVNSAKKLYTIDGGRIVVGITGTFRINQYIISRISTLTADEFNSLQKIYKLFGQIIKDFKEDSAITERTLEDDGSNILLIVNDSVYDIFLMNDGAALDITDISHQKCSAIGYCEELLGAIWNEIEPITALKNIIPHHSKLDFPITTMIYDLELHKVVDIKTYEKNYFMV